MGFRGDGRLIPVARQQPFVLQIVLDVVHGMDDTSGAEEEAGLEEGVRHYVEDRHEKRAYPGGHEHETQLRHR